MKSKLKLILACFTIFMLASCGGGGKTPTPTPPVVENRAPIFSVYDPVFTLIEGELSQFPITVSDPDNDPLEITLSGEDGHLFEYDVVSGILSFIDDPIYTQPADAQENNVYELIITASDGSLSAQISVQVIVTNNLLVEIITPINGTNLGGVDDYEVLLRIIDPDDEYYDTSSLVNISVNGAQAGKYKDHIDIWSVKLTSSELNNIQLLVTDSDGTNYIDDISVTNLAPLTVPADLVLDESRDQFLVLDTEFDGILSVARDGSHSRVILSGKEILKDPRSSLKAIELDTANGRLMMLAFMTALDPVFLQMGVFALDLDTLELTTVSSEVDGPHIGLNSHGIAIYGNTAIIADKENGVLQSVDIESGKRTILSGDSIGAGPLFDNPLDVTVDTATGTAYVLNESSSEIIAVDIATGNRTLLSNNASAGPLFEIPDKIAFDVFNNRLLVSDKRGVIFSINITNGSRSYATERYSSVNGLAVSAQGEIYFGNYWGNSIAAGDGTIVVSTSVGSGLGQLHNSRGLVFDSEKSRVYSLNPTVVNVVDVDLAEKNILCFPVCSSHVKLGLSGHMTLSADNSSIFLTDVKHNQQALLSMSPVDGVTTLISGLGTGVGDVFENPIRVSLSGVDNIAYVLDAPGFGNQTASIKILRVNLESGDREVISSNFVGLGDQYLTAQKMLYFAASDSLLVVDSQHTSSIKILSVDTNNGDREIIYSGEEGIGPEITDAVDIISISETEVAILSQDSKSLYLLDITSGNRQIISGPSVGDGIIWINPTALTYDAENQRFYVADPVFKALFVVDMLSGNRSLLIASN